MKEVIIRFLSGVLYVSLVLSSLFTSSEWYLVLIFCLTIVTLHEFLKLISLKGVVPYILVIIPFYFIAFHSIDYSLLHSLLFFSILMNVFLFRDVMLLDKITFFKSKRYLCVIFYIISGFIFLTLIPYIGSTFQPKLVLGIFILTWTNDTFAYLIGKKFGKIKLKEKISPKKTIEGFIGGLLAALIGGVIIFNTTLLYSPAFWLLLALLVSVLGTTGDLIQSKFKRLAGVKDSGRIMPGHGGVYDRLDSIIFASPFIYLFIIFINYVS